MIKEANFLCNFLRTEILGRRKLIHVIHNNAVNVLPPVIAKPVIGDRVQPAAEGVPWLIVVECPNLARYGNEDLLPDVCRVSLLQAGPATPTVHERGVKANKFLPCFLV